MNSDKTAVKAILMDRLSKKLDKLLETQTVTTPFQDRFEFDIDPFRKHCLLNGVDEIGLTLKSSDAISAYEGRLAVDRPWLVPNYT